MCSPVGCVDAWTPNDVHTVDVMTEIMSITSTADDSLTLTGIVTEQRQSIPPVICDVNHTQSVTTGDSLAQASVASNTIQPLMSVNYVVHCL